MKVLVKQVIISDKLSPHNGSIKDILVIDGKIAAIESSIAVDDAQIIDVADAIVSPGWVDVFAHFNDPGFEYKETIETGTAAAASGGYTNVFVLPNTSPVVSTKSVVEYVLQKAVYTIVNVLPLGAVTKNAEGKELAEMYDMRNSGALAFSDGLNPIQTPALLLKALQYVKAFDGTIIQLPVDKSVSKLGLMNEGITSTRLGLPGIPSIAEELMISRDIELTKYTNSKLHITGVSTAKGLELIRAAKAEGINVTCSVTPYHLYFSDEDLTDYDTNLKVDPPLRSKSDMMALRKGVEDGSVDCIASHHSPQNWDNKTCEFEYAQHGMIGLQTAFSVVNQLFPKLPSERLNELLSANARNIFSLATGGIEKDKPADFTIYKRHKQVHYTIQNNKSRSTNSPFFDQPLQGEVIGIISKDQVYLNP
jgi:dihydroorotase